MKPAKSEAPAVAAAQGFGDGANDQCSYSPGGLLSGQALQVIEGEQMAAQYLARVRAGQVNPEELSHLVAPLYGLRLRGFCRVVAKALESCNGP